MESQGSELSEFVDANATGPGSVASGTRSRRSTTKIAQPGAAPAPSLPQDTTPPTATAADDDQVVTASSLFSNDNDAHASPRSSLDAQPPMTSPPSSMLDTPDSPSMAGLQQSQQRLGASPQRKRQRINGDRYVLCVLMA